MNADGTTPPDVQANLGIEIPHSFVTALAIFAAGLILLALGILLTLFRRGTGKIRVLGMDRQTVAAGGY